MGKSLKGKELGRGLYQRSDGLYVARIYTKGSPKPIYLYDSNLAKLKKKRDHEKARYIMGLNAGARKYTPYVERKTILCINQGGEPNILKDSILNMKVFYT